MTLACCLRSRGASVIVADDGAPGSSSRVATGLIHPITGRRIVKTWMADTLIPEARAWYRALEGKTDTSFFRDVEIVEAFTSAGNRNDWSARTGDPAYAPYIKAAIGPGGLGESLLLPLGGVTVQGYHIDTSAYLSAAGHLLGDALVRGTVTGKREWNGMAFGRIIDCTGYLARSNPRFGQVPLVPVKGETLTIQCAGLPEGRVFNAGKHLLPLGGGRWHVGSTFDWRFRHTRPSGAGRAELEEFLDRYVTVPYRVEAHQAAVRPAIDGRRPVIGMHPDHPDIGLFNGLGTKGVLLAPWLAAQFTAHLLDGAPLHPETDIARFYN